MSKVKIPGDWTVRDMPQNKLAKKAPNPMTPIGISMHNTANSAPASNEISYMQSNNNSTGFHFAIDENQAIQGAPLNRNTWHSGDGNGPGNRKHIGVEIARSTDQTPGRFAMAEKRSAAVVAKLLQNYGWGIGNIKAHRDFSGKNCPHRTSMTAFKDLVRQALDGKLTGSSTASNTDTGGTKPTLTGGAGKAQINTDVLNVRSAPNTSSSILGTLKRGQTVSYKGEANGWYGITYNGKDAYISKQYTKAVSSGSGASTTTPSAPAAKTATVNTDVLNVRAGASTNHAVLGTLKRGQVVSVKGETNGWLNITYGGKNAYISKQYTKAGGTATSSTAKTATVNTDVLNVRAGASTNHAVLGTLKRGQVVSVKGETNGWLNITYSGKNAYISKQYTRTGGTASTPATKSAKVTTSVLNVRAGAGTNFAVLGTLKSGQTVTVKGESNGWLNITFNGKNAYISKQYTSLGSSSTPVTAPPSTKTAKVTTSVLNVRSGPGTGYRVLGTVKSGQTLTVVGNSGNWLNIKYGSGNGFVSKDYTSLGSGGGSATASGRAAKVIQIARQHKGSRAWPNLCQAFVSDMFIKAGINNVRRPSAKAAEASWGGRKGNPPAGAALYMNSNTQMGRIYGHVGIATGVGQNVIHSANGVVETSANSSWSSFSSWGWHGGTVLN